MSDITGSWCPECGPNVKVDEDACCSSCGATCTGPGTERALTTARALEEARAEVERLTRERDEARELAGRRARERDSARLFHSATVGEWRERAEKAEAERDEAQARVVDGRLREASMLERAEKAEAALNNALSGEADAVRRAESAELGCEIAYQREPTQAEGDAHADGADECFVAMGGWTGRRCRACGRWVWGGPTACEGCVRREERDEARAACAQMREALEDILNYDGGARNALEDVYVMERADAALSLDVGRGYVKCPCNCHDDGMGVAKHADCKECEAALDEEQSDYEDRLVQHVPRGYVGGEKLRAMLIDAWDLGSERGQKPLVTMQAWDTDRSADIDALLTPSP